MVDDITHEIPPGDIRAGAFALAAAHPYFRKKTVHVALVDPGVGSPRAALAVQTRDYFFIGPNNGKPAHSGDGRSLDPRSSSSCFVTRLPRGSPA